MNRHADIEFGANKFKRVLYILKKKYGDIPRDLSFKCYLFTKALEKEYPGVTTGYTVDSVNGVDYPYTQLVQDQLNVMGLSIGTRTASNIAITTNPQWRTVTGLRSGGKTTSATAKRPGFYYP